MSNYPGNVQGQSILKCWSGCRVRGFGLFVPGGYIGSKYLPFPYIKLAVQFLQLGVEYCLYDTFKVSNLILYIEKRNETL